MGGEKEEWPAAMFHGYGFWNTSSARMRAAHWVAVVSTIAPISASRSAAVAACAEGTPTASDASATASDRSSGDGTRRHRSGWPRRLDRLDRRAYPAS